MIADPVQAAGPLQQFGPAGRRIANDEPTRARHDREPWVLELARIHVAPIDRIALLAIGRTEVAVPTGETALESAGLRPRRRLCSPTEKLALVLREAEAGARPRLLARGLAAGRRA